VISDDALPWALFLLGAIAGLAYLFFLKRASKPNIADGALFHEDRASVIFKGMLHWSISFFTAVSVTDSDLRIESGPLRSTTADDFGSVDGPTVIPRSNIRSVESARWFWRKAQVVKVKYDIDGRAAEVQLAVRDSDKLLAMLSART
jgi:hypothetical protein